VQHLVRDVTEVVELREEVTRARAIAIMVVLLATAHEEADKVAWRVFALECELRAVRQARGATIGAHKMLTSCTNILRKCMK
jgi:hypothetical protein